MNLLDIVQKDPAFVAVVSELNFLTFFDLALFNTFDSNYYRSNNDRHHATVPNRVMYRSLCMRGLCCPTKARQQDNLNYSKASLG